MEPTTLVEAGRMAERRQPFVLATVVWRRGPSSGQQGSTALILPDGTVHGWLGGACAAPTVVREARQALSDGRPRLLFLGPAAELDGQLREGVTTVPMACESEGAMEVYLEPVVPKPRLLVIGHSPAARMLTSLANALEWEAVLVDDGGIADGYPEGVEIRTTLDLTGVDAATMVVVATQGHYDEAALEAALATPAAYVGLVASSKRAASVKEYLADRGVPAASLKRIDAPAGLDLGSIAHSDMAVAILADLVRRKAAGLHAALAEVAVPAEAIDPVCGMTVDVAKARHVTHHEGVAVYFCAAGCKTAFEADPAKYGA